MFSKIRQALQTVAARQHLAFLLAAAATVQPLVLQPGPPPRWPRLQPAQVASLPQVLQHPLVRAAIRFREWRLLRLQRRTGFRRST